MTLDKKDRRSEIPELRLRAEQAPAHQSWDIPDLSTLSPADIQQLLHELRVHQIELEMQNDELRLAQLALEQARDKYLDLYNYAPVAYFTLDKNGLISDTNLTAVQLGHGDETSLAETFFPPRFQR